MIDQAFLKEHVWGSVKETFETMIALPVELVDGEVELDDAQAMICVITFGGPLEGSFSACCAKACAEKIGKAMLMMSPDDPLSEAERSDAFGEVVNMLIGGFKSRVSEVAPDIQISIPSVFEGLDIQPKPRRGASRVDISTTVDGLGHGGDRHVQEQGMPFRAVNSRGQGLSYCCKVTYPRTDAHFNV